MKAHNTDDDVEVDDLLAIVPSIGKDFDQRAVRQTRTVLLKLWRQFAAREVRKLKPLPRRG
jgi:hypothetical protein